MKNIAVEVAFIASNQQSFIIPLVLTEGSSIKAAILQSGLLTLCTEINLEEHKIGVYGEKRSLSDPVFEGDRVEIYRRLIIDPKEKRRLRAKNQTNSG